MREARKEGGGRGERKGGGKGEGAGAGSAPVLPHHACICSWS